MSYRHKPKYASRDARQGPWTMCDQCGFIWSHSSLSFQYDFMGGPAVQNTRILVCPKCEDGWNYQNQLFIIPPDPPPYANTRPEPYTVDETNFLATEDDDVIIASPDVPILTNQPDTDDVAATTFLVSTISAPGGSVVAVYLDLFLGNPAAGGSSILAAISGSAVRTNIAAQLTQTGLVALNTAAFTVLGSPGALGNANITHIGLYNQATGGTLLMSGTCSASPTIAEGNLIAFDALALTINL
jgi:hypothetical protein